MESIDLARSTAVREAFARVEEAPEYERPALLAALPEAVREEVESLLTALHHNPGFLAEPEEMVGMPGSTVGPYTILEEIGRGGMGVVYRAERRDGEFRKEVAIKIAGGCFFPPAAERRFIRERQILASLDHPNIVRLLDGGLVQGRRYFVMELVRGAPIDTYAGALPMEERLRLFTAVCGAVHYAHQKLILHRDLKPGNVLVGEDRVAKVLDFGIAQIVQEDQVPGSSTVTLAHPFSLCSASPEQLRGEPLTLASDIYSLGLLLYQLVTGVNPQYTDGDLFHQTFARAGSESHTPPSKLVKGVRRDLDAVVAKAMAKEPERRYASVAELQADVERYLANRPVLAVPPSTAYLAARFIRRNRALSATVAIAILTLAAGFVMYMRQARLANIRFEEARRLVRAMVFDIQPRMADIPETLPLRQRLLQETVRYLEAIMQSSSDNIYLVMEIANTYAELAQVKGDGNNSNLGDPNSAAELYHRACKAMDHALGIAPNDPAVIGNAARLYARRASFAHQRGARQHAQEDARHSVELGSRVYKMLPKDQRAVSSYALSLFTQGQVTMTSDWQASAASFTQAGDLYRSLAAADSGHLRSAGLTDRYLMSLYLAHADLTKSEFHARRALQIAEQRLAAAPESAAVQLDYTIDLSQMGAVLGKTSKADELPYIRKAFEMRERLYKRDPLDVRAAERLAITATYYGTTLRDLRQTAEARILLDRAIALFSGLAAEKKLPPVSDRDYGLSLQAVGDLESLAGHHGSACEYFRRASVIYDRLASHGQPDVITQGNMQSIRKELAKCP